MNKCETTEMLFSRAAEYADHSVGPMNSGHLLLAILTGTGAASKTLSLRGLSETRIRTALRADPEEIRDAMEDVHKKARQYARAVGVESPAAIHLLAALATVKGCVGHRILVEAGLNTDVIRNQALRNMTTGLTREHGYGAAENREVGVNSSLFAKSAIQPSGGNRTTTRAPIEEPVQRPLVARPANMGQNLEIMQKKTREARSLRTVGESVTAPTLPRDVQKDAVHRTIRPVSISAGSADVRRIQLSAKEFPNLASMGRNLSEEAALGRVDPVVGRMREMDQIIDVLNKRRANCPCLIGPPGVGKTAIVGGLAYQLAHSALQGLKENTIIVEIRSGDLLGGTSLRGALSEKIEQLKAEISRCDGRVILFFDEVHTLLGSGDAQEAIGDLKISLERGELPCIAATQDTEWNKLLAQDAAWARLFTSVEVAEPSIEESVEILTGLAPDYGDHHQVEITPEAILAAVKLSSRYLPDSALPDKAVALMDLAGSRARRAGMQQVVPADVAAVVANQISVPVERLTISDGERLLHLETDLSSQIVGHTHVMEAIGETLRRNAAGFRNGRPIGSFLFLGPTGVGKTETAKVLARLLFSDESAMIRLDMSEFSESHAVARLVGAPPGYVGHEEGGQLTEAVRKRPYSLVLLDEIEKAHRDVIQILLQVLDDGRLTDGRGNTVVFENTLVIMTSNLGSDLRQMVANPRRVGFGSRNDENDGIRDLVETIEGAARDALPPELWNRIDEPLVFAPLEKEQVAQIARLMLQRISGQLQTEHGISLLADEAVVEHLVASGGFDMQLGARPMRRTIQRLVEGPVARIILSGKVSSGNGIRICKKDGQELDFSVEDAQLDGHRNTEE